MPTPILQYSIHNILQYISPPSLILEPLPHHIISKSLHQRHHFLNIDPSSPEYLCWPSPNTTAVIHLLESFVRPVDDDEYATYPVRYSSDGEWVYAHVHVCSGALRIVFQWDESEADGWKFHDANLMPFPRGSSKSLHDAISGSTLDQAKLIGDHSLAVEEDDIDTYWDAYGQENDEDSDIHEVKDDNQDSTDDSYWAQYAGVQGSGDSTQPSPLHTRRQSHLVNNVEPPYRPDSASDSAIEFSHPSFRFRSSIEGPSPGQLTDLLNAVSPRSASPPFFNDSNSTTPSPPSPESISHPVFLNMRDIRDGESKVKGGAEEAEESLRQSIRGILQLWKAGRRKNVITSLANRQEENELFLRIVRQIAEEP